MGRFRRSVPRTSMARRVYIAGCTVNLCNMHAMTDIVSRKARSALMSRIKGRDTKPELAVRRLLHAMGYRFRLHLGRLPGSPDIVLPRYHSVILVHGCFWHRHGCARTYSPKTRKLFWQRKFESNRVRDRRTVRALRSSGWRVLTVWECQTEADTLDRLATRLRRFLSRELS